MIRRNRRLFVVFVVFLTLCQTYRLFHNRTAISGFQVSPAGSSFTFNSSDCPCSRQVSFGDFAGEPALSWCSFESTMRGRHQNVVAYSLFGDAVLKNRPSKYFDSLQTIADQIGTLYPEWRMRIYHNFRSKQSLEHGSLCRIYCANDHVDVCDVGDIVHGLNQLKKKSQRTPITAVQLTRLNKLLWRFLPLLDPTVDLFMARDSDAEVVEREASAVRQWLQSDRTFHVMRDHQLHDAPILSGMFGAKMTRKREAISSLVKVMVTLGQYPGRSEDQDLLEKVFWPSVKDDAVIHDSYSCEYAWNSLPTWPFPTRRVNFTFVSDRRGSDWLPPEKCPVACRPADHLDWDYC